MGSAVRMLAELRRRKVVRVALTYGVVAWAAAVVAKMPLASSAAASASPNLMRCS